MIMRRSSYYLTETSICRELHWHPTQDEWSYYLLVLCLPHCSRLLTWSDSEGNGRATLFASSSNARTFNYEAGDVGFVPASYGHYVENTSNTTLRFLEIFNTNRYQDISLNQVRYQLCCSSPDWKLTPFV